MAFNLGPDHIDDWAAPYFGHNGHGECSKDSLLLRFVGGLHRSADVAAAHKAFLTRPEGSCAHVLVDPSFLSFSEFSESPGARTPA